MNPETIRQNKIREWAGQSDDVMLMRLAAGRFLTLSGDAVVSPVPKGCPDLLGCCVETGRMIGLEIKTPTGKAEESQVYFAIRIIEAGGFWGIALDVEEAKDAVRLANIGLSTNPRGRSAILGSGIAPALTRRRRGDRGALPNQRLAAIFEGSGIE